MGIYQQISPILVILALIGNVSCGLLKSAHRKNLAGPPSEFNDNLLPSPINAAVTEESSYFEIWLQANEDEEKKHKLKWTTDLVVDSSEEFTLSFFSPLRDKLTVILQDPNGEKIHLDKHRHEGEFPIGEAKVPETTWRFKNPKTGVYSLSVISKTKYIREDALKIVDSLTAHGAILIWNRTPLKMHTYLNTYSLHIGQEIGLVTTITQDSQIIAGVQPKSLVGVVSEAEMDIILPDGSEVDVPLHDDGLHGDLEENDGIYAAVIPATEVGVYQAKAILRGKHGDISFVRTTQHMIPVVNPDVSLSSSAWAEMQDKERVNIFIEVDADASNDKLYRGYAEVYGKDSSNNDVPACWISSMVDVQVNDNKKYIVMELNLKWLAMANAKAPITLKNVLLQETTSFVPISTQDEISVKTSSNIVQYIQQFPLSVSAITPEMRRGLNTLPAPNVTVGDGKLILVHGYCSGDNPWKSGDFTNDLYFLQPNSNVNNEVFAEQILAFAEANKADVFSIVAHSQGGMAALHLLNYFESGLDFAEGGRRIQTVGTPFNGCSAAGTAASLGTIFGIGCGSQPDLTVDGAELWLRGITQESQKEVYSYTTTYELGNFFGDYCNMAINAILEWPNDGTTELQYAKLKYGNYVGNTEKECHTSDMHYPAQYTDHARNREMNSLAAR